MTGGYSSNILEVDLNGGKVVSQILSEEIVSKYIGGSGIAAMFIWRETDAHTDPLSPENPLIFMTGPVTGTQVPSSGRYTVASLSPLTGIWGEAHSGGTWGDELRHTGFDGLVIRGTASRPVYMWIRDGKVEIRDASHLWGKDTFETTDLICGETDPKASVASIGPAGEKLVRFACIMNDGKAGRAAARCGLGAVMGSKNLKAIAVRGTKHPGVRDVQGLKRSVDEYYYSRIQYRRELHQARAREMFEGFWNTGRTPIKNWLVGLYPGSVEPHLNIVEEGEPYFCRRCRTSCGESSMLPHGRRPVHEALGPLGSQCLIDDVGAIDEAYQMCNRLGIDSISTGASIALAMELFDKGLISASDTAGQKLSWGNSEAMVRMVRDIGHMSGFGAILAKGVRAIAKQFGKPASEYEIHVKGLELPAHDPRASNARALGYATVNLGADHGPTISGAADRAFPDLGLYDPGGGVETRFTVEGMGERVAKVQNFGALLNSLVVCRIPLLYWMPKGEVLQPSAYLDWLNLVTGWHMTLEEFMGCGERIFNLQRMIDVRRGINRKDDTLPKRFLCDRLEGGTKGNLPPLEKILGEYYKYRGWSEEGIPKPEKINALGLMD